MNMRYFRCEWLNGIPSGINLHTNMCASYPSTVSTTANTYYPRTEYTTASYWTSTGEYFNNNIFFFEIFIFCVLPHLFCLFKSILLYFYLFIFFYLERKHITKTTSSKTNDEHSPTLTSTKETSLTTDDFSSTTFKSKKHTDPTLFSKSDITLDPIISTISDRNEEHLQSKSGNLFWILILITAIGWICVRCNMKRRCSAESRMNSTSNEDFEMTSVFNENFQETSFDGGR